MFVPPAIPSRTVAFAGGGDTFGCWLVGYPNWSRDGRYVYFDGIRENEEGYYRIRISDGKLERILSLKGFQAAPGAFGNWSGIAPDDSPLLVRDASIQEIYALDWDAP
jgi:hypothetical protein